VVSGRAVVVRLSVLDCGLGPLKVSVAGLNPQLAPAGKEVQVIVTLFPNVTDGDTSTE